MSVAARLRPDWKKWEGEIVDGQFPLERFLGTGKDGAVFLTRLATGNAAIKLVHAPEGDSKDVVERWSRASILDHPNLLKILRVGTWTKTTTRLAYVVTEYAEENLAMVLAERALSSDEVLEMLPPIADALAFLHGRGYALGNLNPSNIFAVQETLKISSDAVAAGDTSADLHALAATVSQALTQKPKTFTTEVESGVVESLPEPFREITRSCLGKNGRSPWSAAQLASWLRAQKDGDLVTTTAASGSRLATAKPKLISTVIALTVTLIVVITMGGLLRNRQAALPRVVSQAAAKPIKTPVIVAPPQLQPGALASAPASIEPHATVHELPGRRARVFTQDEVIRQAPPDIPAKARRTIHGKAVVVVKVVVNQSGDVTEAILEPGGSRYFGRLAAGAARNWRFVSSSGAASREYYLRFEITRTGTKTVLQKTAELR